MRGHRAGAGSGVGSLLLAAGPVVVPVDFMGTMANRWPEAIPGRPEPVSPDPAVNYRVMRTHDGSVSWAQCNPGSGTYNWARLDAIVSANVARGASIMYTFTQTPTWAATPEGATRLDRYGYLGGADKPASLASISTFVTALLTRYNSGASKPIKYIEAWNEPFFRAAGAETWAGDTFFWRSAGDMVDMTETLRAASHAVDPSITVLSPGWDNFHLATTALPWLTTVGPVTGVRGVDSIDGFATHAYRAEPYGVMGIDTNLAWGMGYCRNILAAAGASTVPIYVTEYGVDGFAGSTILARYLAGNAASRRAWMGRTAVMAAINGVKMWMPYAYDSITWGDGINDLQGAVAGFNDGATVAGATLTNAYLLTDGRIKVDVNGVTRLF